MNEVYAAAKAYIDAGLSVIPIALDGTKQPKSSVLPLQNESLPRSDKNRPTWKPFAERLATDDELHKWFDSGQAAIAIVGGSVSGNLERIDFDQPGIYDEWLALCIACQCSELVDDLVGVRTPRDPSCYHLYYRCDEPVQTSQKLALVADGVNEAGKPNIKGAIETRGEAGYTVAPGSPLSVHETGVPYEVVFGDLLAIPTITAYQRECLLELGRSFNEVAPEIKPPAAAKAATATGKPGADYIARGPWRELLETAGWKMVSSRGDEECWRRPGKTEGLSATYNHLGTGMFKVFTSSAYPFEMGGNYSAFGIYTMLEHDGDYTAAARALAKLGYGEQRQRDPAAVSNTPEGDDAPIPDAAPSDPDVRRALSDMGNSERLIDSYGTEIRYVVDWKRWIIWDGVRWATDSDLRINRYAREVVRKIYAEASAAPEDMRKAVAKWALASESERAVAAMVHMAQCTVAITSEALDSDPNLLCCLNGVVDLQKGELLKPIRENLITKQVPVRYDAEAPWPIWDAFLARTQPEDDMRAYLQAAVGYSLTGDVSEQCLFFLYGEGKNGKTTFIETISLLVGEYFTKTGSDSLMIKRYGGNTGHEVAALKSARLVTVSEISDGQQLDEGLVKDMTGGDTMTARHLYGDPFNFKAGFKLWLYGNVKPKIKGKEEGIWRRIKMIPFNVCIPPDQRDAHLADKLKGELSGILNWAIAGCLDWRANGLPEPQQMLDAVNKYRSEQDALAGFIADTCIIDRSPSSRVTKKALWEAYQQYIATSGEPGYESNRAFFKEIDRIPGAVGGRGTGHVAIWTGIRLIDADTPQDTMLPIDAEDQGNHWP